MSVEAYYRYHAKIYDATRWSFLFGRRRVLRRVTSELRPRSILEVGCGTGQNLLYLAQHLPKSRLAGVDLSADMLSIAEKKLGAHRDRVVLRRGAFPDSIPIQAKFDLVLFSYALSMFNPGFAEAIGVAKDMLTDTGRIGAVDFHRSDLSAFRRWMGVNHVRVEGQILPRLRAAFPDGREEIRPAFLGTWTYFTFIGQKPFTPVEVSAPDSRSRHDVPEPSLP